MIPKQIFQTARNKDLPPEIAREICKLRAQNPGWAHAIYTNQDIERFIAEEYNENVLKIFRLINPEYGAAQADLFRYLLMYKKGGVYLDIKSTAKVPFDEVLSQNDSFILTQWDNGLGSIYEGWGMHKELEDIQGGEYLQWAIITQQGHPFLAKVIANVLSNIKNYQPMRDGVGQKGVLRMTGPIAYTRAIQEVLQERSKHASYRYIRNHRELGLVYSIYMESESSDYWKHLELSGKHYSDLSSPIAEEG